MKVSKSEEIKALFMKKVIRENRKLFYNLKKANRVTDDEFFSVVETLREKYKDELGAINDG